MSDNPVPELQHLLGSQVVFLGWPKYSKGEVKKWGHLTVADMTGAYLTKLKDGNIGVVLGEKSGGLCAIDIDKDELVQPFLDLNPRLTATLQTHGARGRVFWVRVRGEYPTRSSKLKTQSGEEIGEFRSNGNQSIIWGIHPTGKPYEFVVREPVAEIEFASIKWPEQIPSPLKMDREGGRKNQHRLNAISCVSASLHPCTSAPLHLCILCITTQMKFLRTS